MTSEIRFFFSQFLAVVTFKTLGNRLKMEITEAKEIKYCIHNRQQNRVKP